MPSRLTRLPSSLVEALRILRPVRRPRRIARRAASCRAVYLRAAAVAVAALVAGATPAAATATLDCSLDDRRIAFAVRASVAHGFGEAISGFEGTVTFRGAGLPAGLGAIALDGESLVHHWLNGPDLRLHVYRPGAEAEPFGEVEIVIETRAAGGRDDATTYRGRFRATLVAPAASDGAEPKRTTVSGRITCGLG